MKFLYPMSPRYLAQLALARLPKPYTPEVTFHVFCEIERTPHLREAYMGLMATQDYTQDGLNQQIGIHVAMTLKAKADGQIDVRDTCELVKYPSLLTDILDDWSWS